MHARLQNVFRPCILFVPFLLSINGSFFFFLPGNRMPTRTPGRIRGARVTTRGCDDLEEAM
jgi:hypothetical protein